MVSFRELSRQIAERVKLGESDTIKLFRTPGLTSTLCVCGFDPAQLMKNFENLTKYIVHCPGARLATGWHTCETVLNGPTESLRMELTLKSTTHIRLVRKWDLSTTGLIDRYKKIISRIQSKNA